MKLFCDYVKGSIPELDKNELTNTINNILEESILFIDNKDLIIDNIINITESINVSGRLFEGITSTSDLTDESLTRMHEEIKSKLSEELKKDPQISKLEEGLFGKLLGATAGFVVGPWITKAICHALGIQSGIVYDFLTSRLCTAAIGSAIGNNIGK